MNCVPNQALRAEGWCPVAIAPGTDESRLKVDVARGGLVPHRTVRAASCSTRTDSDGTPIFNTVTLPLRGVLPGLQSLPGSSYHRRSHYLTRDRAIGGA